MVSTRSAVSIVVVVLAMLLVQGAAIAGPSWSSVDPAGFSRITVANSGTSPYDYILSLDSAPTVTVDSTTYDLGWIQGVYFLGNDTTTTFNATDAGTSVWDWSTEPPDSGPYSVASWEATGNGNRLIGGSSRAFSLSSFDSPDDTMLGFHIGYGNSEMFVNKHLTSDVPAPEPSGILALAAGFGGLATYVRRRRKQF